MCTHECCVFMQFEDFDLESPFTFVQVRDGVDAADSSLGLFTGSELPRVLMTSQADMYVKFSSDVSSSVKKGFTASYRAGQHAVILQLHICLLSVRCTYHKCDARYKIFLII